MVGAKGTRDQTKLAETWMKFAQERTTTIPVKKSPGEPSATTPGHGKTQIHPRSLS